MLEAWRRKRQKKRRGKSGKAKRGEERSEGYENNKERTAKEKAKGFFMGLMGFTFDLFALSRMVL